MCVNLVLIRVVMPLNQAALFEGLVDSQKLLRRLMSLRFLKKNSFEVLLSPHYCALQVQDRIS